MSTKNIEVKKLVYAYLLHYTNLYHNCKELALLSINSFQNDLSDENPLIRALAVRTMCSIDVESILPIQVAALARCCQDSSSYVRKVAALALPRLVVTEDLDLMEELEGLVMVLMKDASPMVVGSACVAFPKVVATDLRSRELIHPLFVKYCNTLSVLDEWGKVAMLQVLQKHARLVFRDPDPSIGEEDQSIPQLVAPVKAIPLASEADLDDFYTTVGHVHDEPVPLMQGMMHEDHKILLRCALPLLKSRNSGVVLAVASLLWECGRRSPHAMSQVAQALTRLVRYTQEMAFVALHSILAIAQVRPLLFSSFFADFFLQSGDAVNLSDLKLKVLVELVDSSNVLVLLKELETYVLQPYRTRSTLLAVEQVALKLQDSKITTQCLFGIVTLVSHPEASNQAILVARSLLSRIRPQDVDTDILQALVRSFSGSKSSQARGAILWIMGHFLDQIQDTYRVLVQEARLFHQEVLETKLQALSLCAKMRASSSKGDNSKEDPESGLVVEYIYELAMYDEDYAVRDQVRFWKGMESEEIEGLMEVGEGESTGKESGREVGRGTQAEKEGGRGQGVEEELEKTNLLKDHPNKTAHQLDYRLDSLSLVLGKRMEGYTTLPPWSTEDPPVEGINPLNQTFMPSSSEEDSSSDSSSSSYEEEDTEGEEEDTEGEEEDIQEEVKKNIIEQSTTQYNEVLSLYDSPPQPLPSPIPTPMALTPLNTPYPPKCSPPKSSPCYPKYKDMGYKCRPASPQCPSPPLSPP